MNKILTISISAFNVGMYISNALESLYVPEILDQIEVFVINDGGTDNTVEIAYKFKEKFKGSLKIIEKQNGGWGSTLNISINESTGKYFRQLDGDDFLYKNSLIDFIKYLKYMEADIIYSPYLEYSDKSHRYMLPKDLKVFDDTQNVFNVVDKLDDFKYSMHCCTIKTNVLKHNNVRLLENCFYTDLEYMANVIRYCKTISCFNKTIYCYRLDREGQSISISGMKKNYKDYLKVLESISNIRDNSNKNLHLEKAFNQLIITCIRGHYQALLFFEKDNKHKQELKIFDDFIHKNYGYIYNENYGLAIKSLRATKFKTYGIICQLKHRKYGISKIIDRIRHYSAYK